VVSSPLLFLYETVISKTQFMLFLLRQIRRKMLSKNKVTTYLLYAIGEIILVVVGILIAVSIDDWNSEQKQNKEEIKLLENFRTSLKGDSLLTRQFIETFDGADSAIFFVLKHMQENKPYHDSLSYHFSLSTAVYSPKIDKEIFETLTANDLNIISNERLKSAIVDYYAYANLFEYRMRRYADIMDLASAEVFNTRFNAIWNDSWSDPHFEVLGETAMRPLDYEKLKQDTEYLYFMRSLKNQLYWYVRSPLKNASQKGTKLLNDLNIELKELTKD